ncbi:hypothetical protein BG011_002785, partial [Mortierella polycephala]
LIDESQVPKAIDSLDVENSRSRLQSPAPIMMAPNCASAHLLDTTVPVRPNLQCVLSPDVPTSFDNPNQFEEKLKEWAKSQGFGIRRERADLQRQK